MYQREKEVGGYYAKSDHMKFSRDLLVLGFENWSGGTSSFQTPLKSSIAVIYASK
jgi:hypothetical protein